MGALQIAAIASEPIPQAYSGKYDVIGQQDGKKYSSTVIDSPSTGLINSQAILVGEKPELIVDPATTKNLIVNYPDVIEAIHSARIPQFASGDYSNISGSNGSNSEKQIAAILTAQTLTMDRLNRNLENGIQAKLLANDEYIRTHKDVDSLYSKLASKANSSVRFLSLIGLFSDIIRVYCDFFLSNYNSSFLPIMFQIFGSQPF